MRLDDATQALDCGQALRLERRARPGESITVTRTDHGLRLTLGPERGFDRCWIPEEWHHLEDFEVVQPPVPAPEEGLLIREAILARGWTKGLIRTQLGAAPTRYAGRVAWPLDMVCAAERDPAFEAARASAIRRASRSAESRAAKASRIAWPNGRGIRIEITEDAILVTAPYEDALTGALWALRGSRWDRNRGCWVIPLAARAAAERTVLPLLVALFAKREAKARQREAEAIEAAAAFGRLVWPAGTRAVLDGDELLVTTPYDAAATDLWWQLGRWDTHRKAWRMSPGNLRRAHTLAVEVAERRAAEDRNDDALRTPASARENETTTRSQRLLMPFARMPQLGTPCRIGTRILVGERIGLRFGISQEAPSVHGSHLLGHEGEWGAYWYYREATEDERRGFEAAEVRATAVSDARRHLSARLEELLRAGECPAKPDMPRDRLQHPDAARDAYGFSWAIAREPGWLWIERGNGADGDDWSQNNAPGAIQARLSDTEGALWRELAELVAQAADLG